MRNEYDWIEPGVLIAASFPATDAAFTRLREAGVGLLINLTDQRHDPLTMDAIGLRELNLPVADFTPPAADVLDAAILAIERTHAEGQAVAIHCLGGLGRTGTVVAAWLVSRGMDADSAIARVRELRPGSIETPGQVRAVHEYAARTSPAPAPDQA